MSHLSPKNRAVVLLPTFEEVENLPQIVPAILEAAPVDIMVLDDGSPDGTGRLADALAAAEPRVKVVHRPKKEGLGAAYLDGFERALKAGYSRIIEMDADFSHPPAILAQMLTLSDSYAVVLGSRWVEGGGTRNWPWTRRVLSRAGSLYARLALGVEVRDLTGGFKCFHREVLEAIPLGDIKTTGYAFQIELTYRAILAGFKVIELPITFVDRTQGSSKMSKGILAEALIKVPMLRLMRRVDAWRKAASHVSGADS